MPCRPRPADPSRLVRGNGRRGFGRHPLANSPEPFLLSSGDVLFRCLGTPLLAWYRALNRLYFESVHGTQPAWVAAYLDQGKPDSAHGL